MGDLARLDSIHLSPGTLAVVQDALLPTEDINDFVSSALLEKAAARRAITFRGAAKLARADGRSDRYLDKITDVWGDMLLSKITPQLVRRKALELYPEASASTRNRIVLSVTSSVVNYAVKVGAYDRPLRLERFKETKRENTPVDVTWVRAFQAAASPHLGALALFLFTTGARISEALALTWADVDVPNSMAYIRQTKTDHESWRHIPAECLQAMLAIQGDHRPETRVFRYASRHSAKRPWHTACRRAGIKMMGFISCRHGFATSLLHAGVDPVSIAQLGGWKSTAYVFSTYGHAQQDKAITERLTER